MIIILSPWWHPRDRVTDEKELINVLVEEEGNSAGEIYCFVSSTHPHPPPYAYSNQVASRIMEGTSSWMTEKNDDKTFIVTQFTSFEQSEVALCAR